MLLLSFRCAFSYANSFIHIAFVADFLQQLLLPPQPPLLLVLLLLLSLFFSLLSLLFFNRKCKRKRIATQIWRKCQSPERVHLIFAQQFTHFKTQLRFVFFMFSVILLGFRHWYWCKRKRDGDVLFCFYLSYMYICLLL